MVFTKKDKRHRQSGMNAFDKKIMRGILSVAGTGLIVSSMTSAYAAPTEPEKQLTKAVELTSDPVLDILKNEDIVQPQVIQIPELESETNAQSIDAALPAIQIIPKPEPKPVVVEKKEEVVLETVKEEESVENEEKIDESNQDSKKVDSLEVIKADSSETKETKKEIAEENFGSLIAPLDSMNVSSTFGYRIHPVYGKGKMHEGTDLQASCGTPVYAAADGKVVQSGYKNGRAGNVVEIDHGMIDGKQMSTNYYHLSKTIAENGSVVKQGDLIGEVGTTGTSTGCHLHWGMTVNGEKTDPMPYLRNS